MDYLNWLHRRLHLHHLSIISKDFWKTYFLFLMLLSVFQLQACQAILYWISCRNYRGAKIHYMFIFLNLRSFQHEYLAPPQVSLRHFDKMEELFLFLSPVFCKARRFSISFHLVFSTLSKCPCIILSLW